jgi:tyrosinase
MKFPSFSRRTFLATAAAGAAALQFEPAQAAAKYKRWNVNSPQGRKALESYAKGVRAMLALPADHPHNWFRNAFFHLMDCPHGNWWFYVWHRGYIGYFEQTIRSLSGDPDFALPFWDWTQPLTQKPPRAPGIPEAMFSGVLTPTDAAYEPYTKSLAVFTDFIKSAVEKYWNGLSPDQKAQLAERGLNTFDDLWNGPNGVTGGGIAGDSAFAITSKARYLSKSNPLLDKGTATAVSVNTVIAGLLAPNFYDADVSYLSFTSSKTASHSVQPGNTPVFSVLEGQPHNLVHNCIGGVGAIDPGPYGNMTNFLSPVDPIFFLHHANMDRLWDVWTRKQIALKQPFLPPEDELKVLSEESFRFFVDASGNYVLDGKAGDYLSTDRFNYEYDGEGFGESLIGKPKLTAQAAPTVAARLNGNAASIEFSTAVLSQLRATEENSRSLVAQVTVTRPEGTRQINVFVGAPADATDLGTDSPYYVGTVGFFGPAMVGMHMSHEATFAVPLPPRITARAGQLAATETHANFDVTVAPVGGKQAGPLLKAVSIGAL